MGDLLIYHGTEQFFKDHHINVTLKRCEYDLDLEEVKAKNYTEHYHPFTWWWQLW